MVGIGGMGVRMARPFVRVAMRMLARRVDLVRVRVVAIVVSVCVLVILRFVFVDVLVGLGHVEPHAGRT
jgi:hypothetical protein